MSNEVYNDQMGDLTRNKTKQSLVQRSTHSLVRSCPHWTESFPLQLSSVGIVYTVVWRQEKASLPLIFGQQATKRTNEHITKLTNEKVVTHK